MGGDTLQVNTAWFALVALAITIGGVLAALFKMVGAAADKQAPVIDALRKELAAEIEKQAAINKQSQHDLRNTAQASFTKLDTEVDRLKREAVRREDMNALETRLTSMLLKMETKLDKMGEQMGSHALLEKQMNSLDQRLGDAVRRQASAALSGER